MVPMRRHTSNLLDTFLSKPKTSTKRSASPLECLEHGSALWRFDRSEVCRVCQRHNESKMRSRTIVDFGSTARAGTCRSARAQGGHHEISVPWIPRRENNRHDV